MNCIHKKMTEQTPLNLKPTASSSRVGPRPVPTASLLKPWEFDYSPSPDGKDLNLLIMFHGLGTSARRIRLEDADLTQSLGDTKGPFFKLAKSFNLPGTAVLSLQAPTPCVPPRTSCSHAANPAQNTLLGDAGALLMVQHFRPDVQPITEPRPYTCDPTSTATPAGAGQPRGRMGPYGYPPVRVGSRRDDGARIGI